MVPASLLPHVRRARDVVDQHYAEPLDLGDELGLRRPNDITMGDGYRRVTVSSGPSRTAAQPGKTRSAARRRGCRGLRRTLGKGSLGAVGLTTDNCQKTFAELAAKGVSFIQEPADRPYGVEAILRDSSGNSLVLVEQKPYCGEAFAHTTSRPLRLCRVQA